jgi:hypothetical protein
VKRSGHAVAGGCAGPEKCPPFHKFSGR